MSELETESPDDPRLLEDYRPLSFVSIVATILALGSCVSIVNPGFWILPVLVAIFSLYAVARVEFSSKKPLFGILAYVGLLISAFAASSTLSYQQFRQNYLAQTARKFADQWLALVQAGELHRPFELTLEVVKRQPGDVDLVKFYRENERNANVTFDYYKIIEPEISLRRAGKKAKLTLMRIDPPKHTHAVTDQFYLNYQIDWNEEGKDNWLIQVTMQRQFCLPPLGPQWSVATVVCLEPDMERKLPHFATEE